MRKPRAVMRSHILHSKFRTYCGLNVKDLPDVIATTQECMNCHRVLVKKRRRANTTTKT